MREEMIEIPKEEYERLKAMANYAEELEHKAFADHSLSKEAAQEFVKDMLKTYLDEKEIEKRVEEAINNNGIEIELQDNCGKRWCHIEDDGANTFIGMYEDGEVKRKLFLMNRKQLTQLVKALKMIINAEV